MASIEKTAYPRFPKRKKISPIELDRSYSLQHNEISMINTAANTKKLQLNMGLGEQWNSQPT